MHEPPDIEEEVVSDDGSSGDSESSSGLDDDDTLPPESERPEIWEEAGEDIQAKAKKAASTIGFSGSALQPQEEEKPLAPSDSLVSLDQFDSEYSGKEYVYRVLRRWKREWREFRAFGVNKADSKVWGQRVNHKKRRVFSDDADSGVVRPTLQRMVKTHQFHEEMQLQLRDESVKLHYSDVFSIDCEPSPKVIRVFSFGASVFEYMKLFLGVWTFLCAWLIVTFWKVMRPISAEFQIVDFVFDILYAICIISQLRTTILKVDRGMEICNKRNILIDNLMDRFFWLDVLSCCPLLVLCKIVGEKADAPTWILLLKACRGWRILRLPPKHKFVTSMSFLLIRICLGMLMGGHLLACVWFSLVYEHEGTMGEHIKTTDKRWQECLSFVDLPPSGCWWRLYSISLNQGIYLLMGIDRDAYSALEHFFLTVCMPLGALVHALVLGEIILLLQRRSALESDKDAHTQAVQEAMRILGLPAGLQVRIITYFTYERLKRCGRLFDQFFTDLSPQLRFELQLHMYLDLVVQTGLFKNMRPRVIREIVMQLQDLIFLPGDWICRYGDYGDSMYFVVGGNCTIIAKDAKTTLKELDRGSYFGEVALLTGVTRTAYVLAKTFCIVAHLTKDGFEPIMRKWPEEIDTLLSGMENEQDRAKIKEEANRYYGLGACSRRTSRRQSRDRRMSRDVRDGLFMTRRRLSDSRSTLDIRRSSGIEPNPARQRSHGSLGLPGSLNTAMLQGFRSRSISMTESRDMMPRRFERTRSQSLNDEVTFGAGSEICPIPSTLKDTQKLHGWGPNVQPSLQTIQSSTIMIPGSVVDSASIHPLEPETKLASDTLDETAQITTITGQLDQITRAVAALNNDVYSRDSLSLSLAELKQTVFESVREVIAHEVGNAIHCRADTPSECGADGGLEAMVI